MVQEQLNLEPIVHFEWESRAIFLKIYDDLYKGHRQHWEKEQHKKSQKHKHV